MGKRLYLVSEKPIGKRIAIIAVAIAIVVIGSLLPTPQGLSETGKMSIVLLLSGLFLWVTEPIPIFISGLAIMLLLPVCGISPFLDTVDPETGSVSTGIWANFTSSVLFFIIASFGITAALLKTKIPTKMVFALLNLANGSSRAVVGAFMAVAGFLSLFISDLPCVALLTSIAVRSILDIQKAVPGHSNLGKALMIGITYAAVVGGQAIPSGSAMNVMTIGMLASQTGISISFLGWSAICLPISVVLLVVCWLSVTTIFKLEPIEKSTLEEVRRRNETAGKLDAFDWKVICILLFTFSLWIASNWTGWDITAIAIVCLILLFIPGLDILTVEEYISSVSWAIVLLIGSVQSIAAGVRDSGGANWLFSQMFGSLTVTATPLVTLAAGFLPLLKILIPIGPAFIAIALIPLAEMAPMLGISPVVFAIMVGVNASTTFIMGIDSCNLLSYRYRFWTLVDFFKAGIVPTIAMILLHATILVPLVSLAGY